MEDLQRWRRKASDTQAGMSESPLSKSMAQRHASVKVKAMANSVMRLRFTCSLPFMCRSFRLGSACAPKRSARPARPSATGPGPATVLKSQHSSQPGSPQTAHRTTCLPPRRLPSQPRRPLRRTSAPHSGHVSHLPLDVPWKATTCRWAPEDTSNHACLNLAPMPTRGPCPRPVSTCDFRLWRSGEHCPSV